MAGRPISSFNRIASSYSQARTSERRTTVKQTGKLEGLSQKQKATKANEAAPTGRASDSFIDASGARVWKGKGS
jgi:hypothetical protein